MLKKTKGGKYEVVSKTTGKPLSKPTTKKKAAKRLGQIEYFKNKKK